MDIYKDEHLEHPEVAKVIEQLRERLSTIAGHTISGNRVTLRWTDDNTGHLVDVHMAILEVGVPSEGAEALSREKRMKDLEGRLKRRGTNLAEELYWVETGKHSQ